MLTPQAQNLVELYTLCQTIETDMQSLNINFLNIWFDSARQESKLRHPRDRGNGLPLNTGYITTIQ